MFNQRIGLTVFEYCYYDKITEIIKLMVFLSLQLFALESYCM